MPGRARAYRLKVARSTPASAPRISFKQINDTYGHTEGDHILVALATILRMAVREGDVIGRLGGDEFVVLLPDADEAGAAQAIERICTQLERFNRAAQKPYALRSSVGNAVSRADAASSVDDLLTLADAAMYRQKRASASERR